MIVKGRLHGQAGRGTGDPVKIRTLSVKDMQTLDAGGILHYGYELRYLSQGEWWKVRTSGRLRTWKRDPSRIEIPVKYGMYESLTLRSEDFNGHRVGIVHHEANPRGAVAGMIPGEVEKLFYQRHGNHPGPYQHVFGKGAVMMAMKNGDVVLRSTRGKKLWGRY